MQEIDVAEALGRIRGGSRLLDVREQEEWDTFHAPQAMLMPLSTIQDHWGEIEVLDDPVIVVCHSGMRSARVTEALERSGVPAVNLSGGMVAWESAGAPVVRGGSGRDGDAHGEPDSVA